MRLLTNNSFKDEVRAFGRQLGIHEELIGRHPFPGPGLGIRIIGEVTPERVEIVRKADHIFISMIREAGIYDEVTQAYAALDSSRGKPVFPLYESVTISDLFLQRLVSRAMPESTATSAFCVP